MMAESSSASYWLDQYYKKFGTDFPVIIGWPGDRIAAIKECLKNGKPVDVSKLESEVNYEDHIIY